MEERVERLCADGRCFVEFFCQFPDLPENAACARIEKSVTQACETVLLCAEKAAAALAARYAESLDPHKHLRLRPLRLRLSFFSEEEKRAYRITWRLCLSRGGRSLLQKEKAARFDKQSGRNLLR